MSLLFTLLIGWILFGTEMDMFVPSFPELQDVFHLSPFMVEFTITSNLVGHCIACLIIGSLGDRYSYRPVILIGIILFVIGSVFCAFATEYYILILGRFWQGVGIAGTTTLSYLVLTNIYSTEKQQEVLGWLNGVITIAMAFAPVIGSYIALIFHWRGNFIVLLIMGIINLIFSYIYIPDNKPNPLASLSFSGYKVVLQSKKTLYYILTLCFSVTPYWIFIGLSPLLYMNDLGVTLYEFGFYQGSMAALFAIASFSNGFFIRKFGTRKYTYFGIFMAILFIISCSIALIVETKNPLMITVIMHISSLAAIVPSNILYPLMFEEMPDAKGKTSAILTAIRMILIACGVQLAGYFYDGTFMALGIILIAGTIAMLWFMYKLLITEGEIEKLKSPTNLS
jgi:DHA1 family bicyclomycin/chloramphenicol resistance-like MFS transporter